MEFYFPEGLMLGVSSAATQIEGGETGSNWNDWYHRGHIKDGANPAVADEHWERWEEDTRLMAQMGIRTYRFGVEWSRLFPEPHKPDEAAAEHYRREILAMKAQGIEPLLTIHHFSNPMWFEEKGAFACWENREDYLELVRFVVQRFGDLVSDYITINEPNVYATNGYCFGEWPPGHHSYRETFTVLSNMAWCHIKAYELIHSLRREMGYTDTRVGFANHLRVFEPKNPANPWHRLCAKAARRLFQGAITEAMSLGRFRFPLRNRGRLPRGEYSDFNGINYYTRSTVAGLADGTRDNSPRNDLNWEIYPQGLQECAERLQKVLDRPIWVTENGTCDNEDRFRARYIYEHLKVLTESGLPFERYYHWCFCDNFEWIEGSSARFGLVHVDYATQQRTVKPSGEFYRGMIENKGVTASLYETYVKNQEYTVR